jgi:FMN phosphatase YigB (HAD superfamily)
MKYVPAILLDADDTLFDLRTPSRELFAKHGVPFKEEGLDFCENKEIYKWYSRQISTLPGFCRNLEVRQGVREFMNELRKLPVDIRAVTAPQFGPYWIPERTEALFEFGIEEGHIYYCWEKFRIYGDVFVEDNYNHVIHWAQRHRNGFSVVLDHPWTREEVKNNFQLRTFELEGRCTHTNDWDQVLTLIEQQVKIRANWRW